MPSPSMPPTETIAGPSAGPAPTSLPAADALPSVQPIPLNSSAGASGAVSQKGDSPPASRAGSLRSSLLTRFRAKMPRLDGKGKDAGPAAAPTTQEATMMQPSQAARSDASALLAAASLADAFTRNGRAVLGYNKAGKRARQQLRPHPDPNVVTNMWGNEAEEWAQQEIGYPVAEWERTAKLYKRK